MPRMSELWSMSQVNKKMLKFPEEAKCYPTPVPKTSEQTKIPTKSRLQTGTFGEGYFCPVCSLLA